MCVKQKYTDFPPKSKEVISRMYSNQPPASFGATLIVEKIMIQIPALKNIHCFVLLTQLEYRSVSLGRVRIECVCSIWNYLPFGAV
jgi:hypothetical protein